MNILISELSAMSPGLIEYLSALAGVSIYLSISQEDTIRIVHDIKPEVLIMQRSNAVESAYVKQLCDEYPTVGIYVYEKGAHIQPRSELIDFRNYRRIMLKSIIANNKTNLK